MPLQPDGPVIVAVDGSAASTAALDLAADEAMARVTPLVIVHVRDDGPAQRREFDATRRLMDLAAGRAQAQHPGLAVATSVLFGDPVAVLTRSAEIASLLVVGHSPGRWEANSTAARAALTSTVPVLVHRPVEPADGAAPVRPVLVGMAGSGDADEVLAFAFAEAELRGAPLLAMHVHGEPADRQVDRRAREETTRLLGDVLAVWSDKYPDVPVHSVVRYALDAGIALTVVSRRSQLAVVGSPARLPGSVLSVLLHRAGCPVAVVPVTHGR